MATETKYDLAGEIIGHAMRVHRALGCGFNEIIYRNSLTLELKHHGYNVEVEKKIKVYYRDTVVGNFAADLVVNEAIILELKAVQTILPVHEAQLVNYLTATKTDHGLLLNFGAESLQFKKKFKNYQPADSTQTAPDLQS